MTDTINSFSLARLPRIEFGAGSVDRLAPLCAGYGNRLLLVSGAGSLSRSGTLDRITRQLDKFSISHERVHITAEPSPQLVDDLAGQYSGFEADAVMGVGGGSVLDAAKAIAGLLRVGDSVMDYLEGVGPEKPYKGPAVPFIAVPTTAGTGSEATKNAVLSVAGDNGFKKSFRDQQLVPAHAVVDPDLLTGCPPELIAANGMDALTQLMESYVSTRSGPLTDALAASGLRTLSDSLLPWYHGSGKQPRARAGMAYAALNSGITLAQTGLGSVHGLASPLGAFFPLPHGVACGTLVASATRINIDAMLEREADNPALEKYAEIASMLCHQSFATREQAWEGLLALLDQWTEEMQLPLLTEYGVRHNDIDRIVAHSRGSSMQTNPITLDDAEIARIVNQRCA